MKKIASYSIIELIVVMLITTIVIATAYQGYLMFYRQYLVFSNRSEQLARISLLDRLMLSDIENSREIRKQGTFLYCYYPEKEVRYDFRSNCIIRYQSSDPDSFFLHVGQPEFYFTGIPASERGLVDRFAFAVEREKDSITFLYEKYYGADVLINETLIPNEHRYQ